MFESSILETILLGCIPPLFFVEIPIIKNNRLIIAGSIVSIIGIITSYKLYFFIEDWRVCIPISLYCLIGGFQLYGEYKYRKLIKKREEEENNDT